MLDLVRPMASVMECVAADVVCIVTRIGVFIMIYTDSIKREAFRNFV